MRRLINVDAPTGAESDERSGVRYSVSPHRGLPNTERQADEKKGVQAAQEEVVQSLVDDDRIPMIAAVPLSIFPTEDVRRIIAWAVGIYENTGYAPTLRALKDEWQDILDDHLLEVDYAPGPVEYAIEVLQANQVKRKIGDLLRNFALQTMEGLTSADVLEQLDDFVIDLTKLQDAIGQQSLGLFTVPADQVQIKPVLWAWDQIIPLSMVSAFNGLDKIGKSSLLYNRAAALTRGELEGDLNGVPHSVFISSTEDTMSEMIAPRLKAAGADMSKVHILKNGDKYTDMALPDDMANLRKLVAKHRPKMVIIDPAPAHMGKGLSPNNVVDVRGVMRPLARMAEEFECAVVVVVHWNKGESATARNRMSGSGAWSDAARAVITCGTHPQDQDMYVVTSRSSFTEGDTAYGYTLKGVTVLNSTKEKVWTSKAVLHERVAVTEAELAGTTKKETARERARGIILDVLTDEWRSWGEIQPSLDENGIGIETAKKARADLVDLGEIESEGQTSSKVWRLKTAHD